MTVEFERLSARRTRQAVAAAIHPLMTILNHSAGKPFRSLGNAWTRRYYDGDFYVSATEGETPALSLVFVQSRDGNTGADRPAELGGGATDLHLVYEGLSRVASDAVLAGAATASGPDVFFSVWHPELVALRASLGLPRHPAQVIVSERGHVDFATTLLFQVPDVPSFLIAGEDCRKRCVAEFRKRPWITIIPLERAGIAAALGTLHRDHDIRTISCVGGRSTASRLLDEGLVRDLWLTTTALAAGEPNTPFYVGRRPPRLEVLTRKLGTDPHAPIIVEQFLVRSGPSYRDALE